MTNSLKRPVCTLHTRRTLGAIVLLQQLLVLTLTAASVAAHERRHNAAARALVHAVECGDARTTRSITLAVPLAFGGVNTRWRLPEMSAAAEIASKAVTCKAPDCSCAHLSVTVSVDFKVVTRILCVTLEFNVSS